MAGPRGGRTPTLRIERALQRQGYMCIAGLDEAGRGAWAGPLAAAAVVLPLGRPDLLARLRGVRDSKQMTPLQRQRSAEIIHALAVAWAVGTASAQEVDGSGPLEATRLAMQRALAMLRLPVDHLLLDFLRLPACNLPQTALPHGDARVLSIAAASVLAKTTRDAQMVALDEQHPGYGFARHKGYGTQAHRQALQALGPSPVHRLSYAPVAHALEAHVRNGLSGTPS